MARRPPPPAPVEDLDSYSFKAYIRQLADDTGDATIRQFVDTFAEERAAGRPDSILNNL